MPSRAVSTACSTSRPRPATATPTATHRTVTPTCSTLPLGNATRINAHHGPNGLPGSVRRRTRHGSASCQCGVLTPTSRARQAPRLAYCSPPCRGAPRSAWSLLALACRDAAWKSVGGGVGVDRLVFGRGRRVSGGAIVAGDGNAVVHVRGFDASHSVYGRDRPDVEGDGGDAGGSRSVAGGVGWTRERRVAAAVAKADAAALVARGYVGVALDFPCTNAPGFSTTDPTVALDIYHQPGDVSFVLTNLLSLSASPGNPLSGLPIPHGSVWWARRAARSPAVFFNSCCTDSRIGAIEVIKGFPPPTTTGFPLTGEYDWSRPIATYFWSGCLDVVTPYELASSAYAQLGPPKAFVTDPAGSHDTPPTFPDGTTDAFLDRFVAGDASPATAAPFLAADDDPYFAYDLGDSIAAHPATVSCALPDTTPVSAPAPNAIVLAPTFTG